MQYVSHQSLKGRAFSRYILLFIEELCSLNGVNQGLISALAFEGAHWVQSIAYKENSSIIDSFILSLSIVCWYRHNILQFSLPNHLRNRGMPILQFLTEEAFKLINIFSIIFGDILVYFE